MLGLKMGENRTSQLLVQCSFKQEGGMAAAIAIYQHRGSASLDLYRGFKAKCQEFAHYVQAGVSYYVTSDTTDVIKSCSDEVLVVIWKQPYGW